MGLETGLRALLAADPGVSALVADRIRPLRLAQGETYPAITYQRIACSPRSTLDGATGRLRSVVQATCWAESYLEAHALADAVRACVTDYRGTWDGVDVLRIEPPDERDTEPVEGGGAPAVYGVALDLTIHHAQ
jgi:hypothetical protein